MHTTTKSQVQYEIALSNESWTPDGWYRKDDVNYTYASYTYLPDFKVPNYIAAKAVVDNVPIREAVIKWAEEMYGVHAISRHGSYLLKEKTYDTPLNKKDRKGLISSAAKSVQKVVTIQESFRTEAETKEYFAKKGAFIKSTTQA